MHALVCSFSPCPDGEEPSGLCHVTSTPASPSKPPGSGVRPLFTVHGDDRIFFWPPSLLFRLACAEEEG